MKSVYYWKLPFNFKGGHRSNFGPIDGICAYTEDEIKSFFSSGRKYRDPDNRWNQMATTDIYFKKLFPVGLLIDEKSLAYLDVIDMFRIMVENPI